MAVLVINNHDYSHLIERSGFSWSRNDIDSTSTKRNTKTGTMRRQKITTKRKCTFKLLPTDRATLAQLDTDLSPASFVVTIDDLHGERDLTVYCSSFSANCDDVSVDGEQWSGATFSLIEM